MNSKFQAAKTTIRYGLSGFVKWSLITVVLGFGMLLFFSVSVLKLIHGFSELSACASAAEWSLNCYFDAPLSAVTSFIKHGIDTSIVNGGFAVTSVIVAAALFVDIAIIRFKNHITDISLSVTAFFVLGCAGLTHYIASLIRYEVKENNSVLVWAVDPSTIPGAKGLEIITIYNFLYAWHIFIIVAIIIFAIIITFKQGALKQKLCKIVHGVTPEETREKIKKGVGC